jgi:hypothetical protein
VVFSDRLVLVARFRVFRIMFLRFISSPNFGARNLTVSLIDVNRLRDVEAHHIEL